MTRLERRETDLRSRFLELRDEQPPAPTFDDVWRSAGESSRDAAGQRPWLPIAAAAGIAGATMLVVLIVHSGAPRTTSGPHHADSWDWVSTTGFLLDVPGAELLSEVPEIGRPMPVLELESWIDSSTSDPRLKEDSI